jgi:hypothetical protein
VLSTIRAFVVADNFNVRRHPMNSIAVENGLSANFKQPNGSSRPGIDWLLRISGDTNQVVVVRTLANAAPITEGEKVAMAEKAVRYLKTKMEQGWAPVPGILHACD